MTVSQERPDPEIEIREEDLSEADKMILEEARNDAEALLSHAGRFKQGESAERPGEFDRESIDIEIARLWAAVKNESITEEALRDFNHRMREKDLPPSKKDFWSVLNNRAMTVIAPRQLRERKVQ